MRIVCISDTHEQHKKMVHPIPEGDILIHAGDATWKGDFFAVRNFNMWFAEQPHKYKILIAGNHDWLYQKKPELVNSMLSSKFYYLQDQMVQIEGLTFYGSPWQPEFYDWAFNLPRNGPELRYIWNKIPDETNVLITHGPPLGILDKAYDDDGRIGCNILMDRIRDLKQLKLHIFGHIHEQYGILVKDDITFVNASTCNRDYKPVNKPIIVDI